LGRRLGCKAKLRFTARGNRVLPQIVLVVTKSSGDRMVRLQVIVSENELQAIDDYRFQFRLPNRAAAVRALLQTGMTSTNKDDGTDNERAAN
jgi:hypothetical protein